MTSSCNINRLFSTREASNYLCHPIGKKPLARNWYKYIFVFSREKDLSTTWGQVHTPKLCCSDDSKVQLKLLILFYKMTKCIPEIQNYLLPYGYLGPTDHGPYGSQSTGNGSQHWCLYSLGILRCIPRTQVVSSWWVPFEFYDAGQAISESLVYYVCIFVDPYLKKLWLYCSLFKYVLFSLAGSLKGWNLFQGT